MALDNIKNQYKVVFEKSEKDGTVFFKCASIQCPFFLRATLLPTTLYEVDQKSAHDKYCRHNPSNPQQHQETSLSPNTPLFSIDDNSIFYVKKRRKMFKKEPIEIIDISDDEPEYKYVKIPQKNFG